MAEAASTEFLALQKAVVGRYSLERELGRGGMGIVYLARDVALDRSVAIKLLPPHLAAAPDSRERFLREARTAGKLSHPNIVPIHLVEERGDLVYFVMAYVDGESLGERIRRRGALPPSQAVRIVQEVAWALAYAHKEGVVHRDIKPDNILLEKGSERALVTDFGIARVAEAGSMTAKGELVGTIQYMSPEQATGEAVDGRSDLYSLGVTAFHALTGRLPFEGPNLPALIHQHVTEPAPRVAVVAPRVPPRVAEAVDRCLAKDPDQRFGSAEDLATAVNADASARKLVPPEVRSLLRHLRESGIVFGGALAVVAYAPFVFPEILGNVLQFLLTAEGTPLLGLIAGGLLSYPVRLVSMSRRAIRKGLGLADVRAALGDEARALDEELEMQKGGRKELLGMQLFEDARLKKERRERWIRRGPLLTIVGGILVLFILVAVLLFDVPVDTAEDVGWLIAYAILLPIGVLLMGAGPSVEEDSPLRALPITERLLVGRFGRLLFRVAGIGIKQPEAAAPANQLTEAFLASAADQIFDRLPKEIRRRFQEVPAVIERLEAVAKGLRKREESLSRAVAEAAPEAAPRSGLVAGRREVVDDLETARNQARERLEEAVAALENLRLDLLRLHAGVGSPDNLTAALEKGREMGDAIDAELAGRSAVRMLLGEGSRGT